MSKLKLSVVTPERVALEKDVDSVVLPAAKGSMGVLPGHVPYMTRLEEGVLKLVEGGQESFFAVSGGFAQIRRDRVEVFAETAELSEEIDAERARQSLEKARAELVGRGPDPLTLAAAEAAARRAQIRLRVSELRRQSRPSR
jgi:F-type H+-transporting ATPase subunit epsilon